MTINEIEIIPVKSHDGLVAFCSFVLFESIFCGSIAIYTRPDGSYRLVYPTKKIGTKNIGLLYPISKGFGQYIEQEVSKEANKIFSSLI